MNLRPVNSFLLEMRQKLWLLVFLFTAGFALSQAQNPAPETPDHVAVTFYRWYVKEVDDLHHPVLKSKVRVRDFVSSELIDTIGKKRHAGTLDADYFLKAQDTFDDWASHVTASPPRVTGGTARTVVTLGATPRTKRELDVTLMNQKGRWKISRVRALPKR